MRAVVARSGVASAGSASLRPRSSSRRVMGAPGQQQRLQRWGQQQQQQQQQQQHRSVVVRAEETKAGEAQAKEAEEDLPPWVRREREKKAAEATGELPFGLYLLFSSFVAIASIGSIFEFANKNALFGVVEPDSPLWAPILLTFAITGLPTAGYLFVKAISAANKAADAMDEVDGY